MSVTLATVADALIEFILSLLRDPEVAAEFDEDPDAALAARGLNNVSHADVCNVAPVVVERAQVVQAAASSQPSHHHYVPKPAPQPHHDHHDPVIREIKNITQHWQWVDDRDTVVDQSVNQNIWTEGGDLTQKFDNDAVVASGDKAIAVGEDADFSTDIEETTTIEAGDDVQIGDNTTTNNNDIDGSFNEGGEFTQGNDAEIDVEAPAEEPVDEAPAEEAPAEEAVAEEEGSEAPAEYTVEEPVDEGGADVAYVEEEIPAEEPTSDDQL